MIILSIETSCDETALSLIEAKGGSSSPVFNILGNALHSQIDTHAEYGGVFPILAKREHAKNIVPLLGSCIEQAKKQAEAGGKIDNGDGAIFTTSRINLSEEKIKEIRRVLEREDNLADLFLDFTSKNNLPNVDLIAVTEGPGLEPALWVGISFAKALGIALDKPLMPVNHMEGHIVSVLAKSGSADAETPSPVATSTTDAPIISTAVEFPALALLISGGHTELVQINNWHDYKILGATKDDAIGEAFDKVARLIGLPYPGGPKISKLAAESRADNLTKKLTEKITTETVGTNAAPWTLPRPMIKSPDFDFSFSGIKTAVLYAVRKKSAELTHDEQATLAEEFENAVTEVLVEKTRKALKHTGAKTLILGGGVVANTYIRDHFKKLTDELAVKLFVPPIDLSTDNSIMIGIAGYLRWINGVQSILPEESIAAPEVATSKSIIPEIRARGNLSL